MSADGEPDPNAALERAEGATLTVVEVLKLIENTRTASFSPAWQEACDCVEDLVLTRAARNAGVYEDLP